MANPTFETILYDVKDGIATITLNRPDRMNAFTAQMMAEMIQAFDVSMVSASSAFDTRRTGKAEPVPNTAARFIWRQRSTTDVRRTARDLR